MAKETTKKKARSNRQIQLMDAAAELFATRGLDNTSMRDIAAHMGRTAGSIYHHFKSKEDLILAINEEAVRRASDDLKRVEESSSDPWERLEQLSAIHLRSILEGSYAAVVLQSWPTKSESLRPKIMELRQRHEKRFNSLIDDLPIKGDDDRKYFRMSLLGALNYSQIWYRPHRNTPEEIAHEILTILRTDLLVRA